VDRDYYYNAFGQLVRRSGDGWHSYFLWDRGNLFAELNSNATAIMGEYPYYPGLDRLHAYAKTGKIYSAHTDAVENVRAITDSLGGTGATYSYTVWGADAGTTNQAGFGDDMRARFKGALRMADDIELYYMRNRWYEPQSGRFLSEDPIGLAAGINPYVFASNDPVNRRDPFGLLDCPPGQVPDPKNPGKCIPGVYETATIEVTAADEWWKDHSGTFPGGDPFQGYGRTSQWGHLRSYWRRQPRLAKSGFERSSWPSRTTIAVVRQRLVPSRPLPSMVSRWGRLLLVAAWW